MTDEIQDQIEIELPTEADAPADEIAVEADDAPTLDEAVAELDMASEEMAATVEALLFSSDVPLSTAKLGTISELPQRCIKQSIKALNERYGETHSTFRIVEIAGGYQLQTQPEYFDVLRRLFHVRKSNRLSQAAMETLAIVAYRQPILRADIEAVRGVASGEMLRNLMERGLVKIVGRAEVIGRPMLYGTTKKFLEVFGLAKLADLPKADELRSPASKPPTPKDETPLFEDGQASAEGEQESEQTAQQTSEDGDTAPASDIPASPVVPQELTAPVVLSDEDEWDEELDAEEGGLDGDEFDEGDDEEWTDGEADE